MIKIHSFDSFNRILENEGQTKKSKLYDKTLGLILTTALNSYSTLLLFPSASYAAKVKSDLDSVKSSQLDGKSKSLVDAMNRVKTASSDNKIKGAQEAIDGWISVGSKASEALSKIIDQYKDQEEEKSHIEKTINDTIEEYLAGLDQASKDNELKADLKKNESLVYSDEDALYENIFKGKKSMIEDVSKQITIVLAKLSSFDNTPGMEGEVQKLRTEVNKIGAEMGELLGKKNKEIKKEEIKDASARLAEIPVLLDKASESLLKQDNTNKEAASILIQALDLVRNASEKLAEYFKNKGEEDAKVSKDSQSGKSSDVKAEFDRKSIGKVNPEVLEFQKLVTDKFKGSKEISSLTFFKKMGTDGKFGPSTRAMVGIMKSGFGLKDTSENSITSELLSELKKQDALKESRIFSFSEYSKTINEAFDVKTAIKRAKKFETKPEVPEESKKESKETAGSTGPSGPTGPPGATDDKAPTLTVTRGKELLEIANNILKGALGAGTDEDKIEENVLKIKNKWEFKLINDYIKLSYSDKTESAEWLTKKLLSSLIYDNKKLKNPKFLEEADKAAKSLYKIGAQTGNKSYKSIQGLINGEFEPEDLKYVENISSHLNGIGVKTKFDKPESKKGGRKLNLFKVKSFEITVPE
jgi:hypothetical protein